ncbi:MAG: leucine-rich repeat domain-containing protein [Candidatus Latescibacterota bacterium]|jgi:internalin A|nr:leucine-rich repeat domain-containing protein [Candidatus Latescibacterota bacterium]
MKKTFLLYAILLAGCTARDVPLQPGPEEDVLFDHTLFADAALERAVRQHAGQERGVLSSEVLASVARLDLSQRGVVELAGIEQLPNLRRLHLADNSLGDEAMAALASLALLDTLDVAGNGLTRVAHLAALRSLRVLILSDNAITDLTPLAALTGLEILDLGDNIVSDLRPLRGLRRLRQLNLDNNFVRDVAPLTALPQLRRVELSGNPLARSTLSALRQRGVEVTFYAEAMTISSERVEASIRKALDRPVGPLDEDDFLRIRELVISGAVETLGGVEHLKNLEMLSVRGNRALLNDLTPLAELERLRTINIIGAPIADLRPLRDLSLLTSLRVSIGRLTTLNGLGRQIELRELILTGNQIREIHEIRRLLRLQKLDLASNQIRDIAMLTTLRGIKKLNIASNSIVDITPLARMVSLEDVRMAANDIVDISPLLELDGLKVVSLGNNPLSRDSLEEHIPALRARGVSILGVR